MIDCTKKIELLAPAKNKECAIAAIDAGADAVYIGADCFGARKNASNSLDDIKQIVEYAHKFWVKIYVTVNTIFFDKELKNVEKLILKLYKIGVDAIIFQDFSFFEMNLPPIPLHASTQCNNDSIDKIKFLKTLNVERVVLPREFSLDNIKEVTKNVDIETEVFVHGALCVSYSGQCYFSNYFGSRSANRGDCAQPCRKKYSLQDESGNIILKPQYLLSMKDNNLSSHLRELVDAGVTSLKIEGRLKDKDYVSNVVSFYRKEIDNISKTLKPSIGESITSFVPNVNKTFNRSYTDFFFDAKRKAFINSTSPKFVGEYIGKVTSLKSNKLFVDTKHKINVADKLTYFKENGELTGTTVTKVYSDCFEVLDVGQIKTSTRIYRNYDAKWNNELEKAQFLRKIPLSASVSSVGVEFKTLFDCKAIYPFDKDNGYEKAKNKENARENLIKQFSKLGSSSFYMLNVDITDDFDYFIPVSSLNEIRRNLVEKLQDELINKYNFQKRDIDFEYSKYPFDRLDYSFNISNDFARKFYEKCGCSVIENAPECKNLKHKITLMTTKHCLRDFANICLKKTKDNKKLFLVDSFGKKYPLSFDCKKCLMKIEEP